MSESLTPDQLKRIQKFLDFIRANGGYGKIELEVKGGQVVMVIMKEVSAKEK